MSAAARRYARVEKRGRVAWVVLDRPERLNAFDGALGAEIAPALREAAVDEEVRVLVLTGAGRAFCAGADVNYLRELVERRDEEAFGALVDTGREILQEIRGIPKPVIAAVNGPAAGGGANLALACDLRIASKDAAIGQVFIRIGLHPDYGGTFLLPRLVGTARALELMWSGRMVHAEEALALGLFDRVVPGADLEAEVTRLAEELASAAPLAVGQIKASVYAGAAATLPEALGLELRNQLALFLEPDTAEGLQAFLEKRPPVYRGRPR